MRLFHRRKLRSACGNSWFAPRILPVTGSRYSEVFFFFLRLRVFPPLREDVLLFRAPGTQVDGTSVYRFPG